MTSTGRRRAPGRSRDRALPTGWGVGLFAAAVLLPLLRESGLPVWDTVWVEDGPIYLGQANAGGAGAPLFRGYFGYLQLSSRLLAVPTAFLPSATIAAYLAVAATMAWALAAAFVYRCLGEWVASVWCRLAVAAVVVVAPAAAYETNANITNTIWAALLVVPFAVASTRSSGRDVAFRSIAAFLGAASSALALLFLPVALVVAVRRRRRADLVVLAALGAGSALQVGVTLATGLTSGGSTSWRLVADLFGLRVIGSALFGEVALDPLWTGSGEVAVLVLVALATGVFVVLFRRAPAAARTRAGLALGTAVVLFVVPTVGRGTSVIGFDLGIYTLNMTRFTIVPIVLVLTAVALLVDPVEGGDDPWHGTARRAFLIWTGVVLLLGFRAATVRGLGPTWGAERVRALDGPCAGAPDDTPVELTTTPANFSVSLTCGRLRR